MTDRTYTEADINAAIAAALEKAAKVAMFWNKDVVAKRIRNLRPDVARILRERDARVYAEALDAADRTDLPNPYGEK